MREFIDALTAVSIENFNGKSNATSLARAKYKSIRQITLSSHSYTYRLNSKNVNDTPPVSVCVCWCVRTTINSNLHFIFAFRFLILFMPTRPIKILVFISHFSCVARFSLSSRMIDWRIDEVTAAAAAVVSVDGIEHFCFLQFFIWTVNDRFLFVRCLRLLVVVVHTHTAQARRAHITSMFRLPSLAWAMSMHYYYYCYSSSCPNRPIEKCFPSNSIVCFAVSVRLFHVQFAYLVHC